LANNAFFYSLGNNDLPEWYNRYFFTPVSSLQSTVYSFDYGNTLFISIDSNITLESDHLNWLENKLKNTDKKWKVAMTHQADYGRSSNNTALTYIYGCGRASCLHSLREFSNYLTFFT